MPWVVVVAVFTVYLGLRVEVGEEREIGAWERDQYEVQ